MDSEGFFWFKCVPSILGGCSRNPAPVVHAKNIPSPVSFWKLPVTAEVCSLPGGEGEKGEKAGEMLPWDPVELLLREPTTSIFGSDEYKQSLLALSEEVIGWRVLGQGLDPQRFLTSFSPSMNLFFYSKAA